MSTKTVKKGKTVKKITETKLVEIMDEMIKEGIAKGLVKEKAKWIAEQKETDSDQLNETVNNLVEAKMTQLLSSGKITVKRVNKKVTKKPSK